MEREIRNNAPNAPEGNNEDNSLERFAGAEMADRGPKSVSGFTEDEAETRPITNMNAGGGDEDYDDEDDDDDDLETDDLNDDDMDDDTAGIAEVDTDIDKDLDDDDLLLDDEDDDEEDEDDL